MTADANFFFDTFVSPAVEEWRADTANARKAMDAACHLNALVEHVWNERKDGDPTGIFSCTSLRSFRDYIGEKHPMIGLIRDIADAHKHCELTRDNRAITFSTQTKVQGMGWGEAKFGIAEFGESHAMVVTLDDGTAINFARIVWDAMEAWSAILER